MGVLLSVQLLLLLFGSGKLHLLHVLYLELVVIIQCVRIPAKRHNTNTHLNLSEAHRSVSISLSLYHQKQPLDMFDWRRS
jgi:hypothetical protein